MLKKVFTILFVVVGGGLGYQFGPALFDLLDSLLNFGQIQGQLQSYIGAIVGAGLFFLVANL
ncbi:MAG: PIN domain nuclease, partial [Clostridia bacterium]